MQGHDHSPSQGALHQRAAEPCSAGEPLQSLALAQAFWASPASPLDLLHAFGSPWPRGIIPVSAGDRLEPHSFNPLRSVGTWIKFAAQACFWFLR